MLKNRHLPLSDRQEQWQALLRLPLESSNDAIRALSDHEKDENPCTILLPEMNYVKDNFYDNTRSTEDRHCWGFRSITDYKKINTAQDFWRYISFQPQRQSITFYRNALQRIENLELISEENKLKLMRLLAAGTTRFNADRNQEAQLVKIWTEICNVINSWETLNPLLNTFHIVISEDQKSFMRNDLVYHLCRLEDPPNFHFLQHIFSYFKYHFGQVTFVLQRENILTELSDDLNYAVSALKASLYKGCRFYQSNPNWIGSGIENYIRLQKRLCVNRAIREAHLFLSAHLSTFNVTEAEPYETEVAKLNFPDRALTQFTFSLLEDIQSNTRLTWTDLHALCLRLHNREIQTQAQVLDYLEEHMAFAFHEQYFAHKRQYLMDISTGLTLQQIAFIECLNFSEVQARSVKKIMDTLRVNQPLMTQQSFENLVYQFNDLTHILSSSDFTKFIQHLASISVSITDQEEIHGLLHTILETRTCSDFEYIFFRNLGRVYNSSPTPTCRGLSAASRRSKSTTNIFI